MLGAVAQIRDFGLDEDGDMAVANGDMTTVADEAAVPQGIQVRVSFFFGECWLDEVQGIPYIDRVNEDGTTTKGILSNKNVDPRVVRELVREAVADTPDVVDVASSDLALSPERQARVAYAAATVYGGPLLSRTVNLP